MKKHAWMIKLIWVVIPVILLVLVSYLARVTEVKCQVDTKNECPDYVNQALTDLIGQSLLTVSSGQISFSQKFTPEYLLKSYRLIWPNRVEVTLQQIKLVYQVSIDQVQFVVNQDGKLINAPHQTLIEAEIPDLNQQSQVIEPVVHHQLVDLIDKLQQNNIGVQKIIWSPSHDAKLILKSGQVVIFDPAELDSNLARLKLILKSPTMTNQLPLFQTIDVRFRLPVLRK